MQKTILIGEDEENIAEIYKLAFTDAGFRVVSAFNGDKVILFAKQERPDIILLDINMPEKDGFEVLKEISEDMDLFKALKRTPIIIISNYSNQQDINYCMKMGAQDYIVKADCEPHQIVEKVKKYLAKFDELA
jgi:DNA-binding response OmpR family regulator